MNKETIEGNKLIALFMGYCIDNSFPDKDKVYRLGNKIDLDTDFKYHTSWDWLMPVVEKIEKDHDLQVDIYWSCCDILKSDEQQKDAYCNAIASVTYPEAKNKIEAVWLACIEFINWYNAQK